MNIISKPTATLEQAKKWAESKKAPQLFIDLADLYWQIGIEIGVDPVVAYCQFAKESGYARYTGVVNVSFNNPCGLKIKKGGDDKDPNAHKKFDSWEDGIIAHFEHLALYAGLQGFPRANAKDPRHFKYLLGTCTTVEDLGNDKWTSSESYGKDIIRLATELQNTIIEKPKEEDLIEIPEVAKPEIKQGRNIISIIIAILKRIVSIFIK